MSIKPEEQARLSVTVETDRKSVYSKKIIAASFSTFTHANFAHWSFNTNAKPKVIREKIKAKKFVYYYLVYESNDAITTATLLSTDIKVCYTGYAK